MKNSKVIFWNLKIKKLSNIDLTSKYVILADKIEDIDLNKFAIKPIIILYDGALIIDLANNYQICETKLLVNDLTKLLKYCEEHNVKNEIMPSKDCPYEVLIRTENYYRMLVIPSLFQSILPNVKTIKNCPDKIDNEYVNYVTSNMVNLKSNMVNIINYLELKTNDILELDNICSMLVNNLAKYGYCESICQSNNYLSLKGMNLNEI